MDYGKAFSYVFEDSEWVKKVLIGGAIYLAGFIFSFLLFIPLFIAVFLVSGYMIETIQNVIAGQERPLPEWDNWGDKMRKGGIWTLIGAVYSLPLVLFTIPVILVLIFVGEGSNSEAGAIAFLCMCGFYIFFFLYIIFINLMMPAITIKYATTEEFAAAFRLREIFSFIQSNLGPYLIVILLIIAAGWIGSLGAIACYIGMFFTLFYAFLVQGNLYGQLYLESQKTTAEEP